MVCGDRRRLRVFESSIVPLFAVCPGTEQKEALKMVAAPYGKKR